MRPKLCILIVLLLACPVGYGLNLNEDIHVYGDGGMNSRTNTNDAKDMASGSGDQSYHRVLDLEDDSTSLQSSYSYSKNASLKSNILNHYFALANSGGGPQHMVSVYSNSSIDSQSTIERNGNSLSTDYNIITRNGNLSESITNSMNRGKSQFIAEANLQGHFALSSKLFDKTAISRGFDLQDLSSNLDSVVDIGSRGVTEDRTPQAPAVLLGGKELSPGDAAAILAKNGIKLAQEGKLDEALQKFEEALASDPNSSIAWNDKGFVLYQQKNYGEALNAVDKAIELDPSNVDALMNKGAILQKLNMSDEAINVYNAILRTDQFNVQALQNKGVILRDQGKYDEAIKSFDQAIRSDQNFEDAYFARGEAYLLQGNNTKAVDDFDQATNINPKDGDAWNEKGKALMNLGRIDEANAAFSKARELGVVV